MKVKVLDIPATGLDIDFQLGHDPLNGRLSANVLRPKDSVDSPAVLFSEDPTASIHLESDGLTALVRGTISGHFTTACSRCGEDTSPLHKAALEMALKPEAERQSLSEQGREEDLHFGFYQGEEIDCAELAEEFLVLSLPLVSLCDRYCKGLCVTCGTNLNRGKCECTKETLGDERFAVLRGLKIQ